MSEWEKLATQIDNARTEWIFSDDVPADNCLHAVQYWHLIGAKMSELVALARLGGMVHAREITETTR